MRYILWGVAPLGACYDIRCGRHLGRHLGFQLRSQGPLSYSLERERTLVEAGHVTPKISQTLGGKKNATLGRGSNA